MSKWIGYAVSVNCGETLGCYQGTILEADGLTITLTKAFRNGFPYPKSQVTLNAADIKELRIIAASVECGAALSTGGGAHSTGGGALSTGGGAHSTGGGALCTGGSARRLRASVCDTLKANPTSTGNQISNNGSSNSKCTSSRNMNQAPPARTKPVEIQAPRHKNHNNYSGSHGSGSTPKSRGGAWGGRGESAGGGVATGAGGEAARRRNEACFGSAAEGALHDDFDFEGNLALFDKQAVWATMRSSKPDVVRTADESKYRHDENVLGAAGGADGARRVCVPAGVRGAQDYVTDAGCVLPSVAPRLRTQLWEALQRHGLLDVALTLVARAAADVALTLVGGTRRLEARNAHQAPCVVSVCGAHRGGAAGLLAARVLAGRGARVHALVAGAAPHCAPLQRELAALALDAVPLHSAVDTLPAAPDLVLVALYDPLQDNDMQPYEMLCAWSERCRAACVVVEPAGGGWAGVAARACVLGAACVALPARLGRVYLADVAAPQSVFRERGVLYRPPFGAAAVLPLHPHTP